MSTPGENQQRDLEAGVKYITEKLDEMAVEFQQSQNLAMEETFTEENEWILINESKSVKAESSLPAASASASAATGPVSEEEIRAVLMEKKQVTTQDLVSRFKARLKTKEDKNAFAEILKKICKLQKNASSQKFIVLKDI